MGKAALHGLVQSLAIDLAPLVRVNGVAPGVVEWDQQADAAERSRYEARIPLARAGTPDDAAGAVRWLALDAPYVSGTIVTVDGGRALQ
jgi:pteridine reductase